MMTSAAVTNSFVAGTKIESAKVNENFQDVIDTLNGDGLGAIAGGSIAAGAITAAKLGLALPFATLSSTNSKVFTHGAAAAAMNGSGSTGATNNGSFLTVTTGSSRITAVAAGSILLMGQISMFGGTLAATSAFAPAIFKNGVDLGLNFSGTSFLNGSAGPMPPSFFGVIVAASASDYFQIGGLCSGALDITGQGIGITALHLGAAA